MSICRQLDMYFGDGVVDALDNNRDHYRSLEAFIRYCAANGLCTIIASNNGASATSGQGNIGYHEEANAVGENAWIYAEWDAGTGQLFGILIQWAYSATFGTSPGNPGLLRSGSGTDGIGIAMAVLDGGGSPWNGDTSDDGEDAKGATVWTGAGLHVFPRSNSTGGNDVTNKENMAEFIDLTGSNIYHRSHFCADENGLYFICDNGANNTYLGFVCGRYTPLPDLVATLTTPYFMAADDAVGSFFQFGPPYGDVAGTIPEQGGVCALLASDVVGVKITSTNFGQVGSDFDRQHLTPNNARAGGNVIELSTMLVFVHESPDFGMVGTPTSGLATPTYGVPQNAVMLDDTGLARAVIGDHIDGAKHTFPWEGAAPGNGRSREGRQSYSA